MSTADVQTSRYRDAIRILQILFHAGDENVGRSAPEHAVRVIKAEKKLQALDFWVRYPDYLANELMELFENGGKVERSLLEEAASVLDGDEPDLRRVDMKRLFYGAYERNDDALATLVTFGLAHDRITPSSDGQKVKERSYYLLQDGADKAQEIARVPDLRWFSERAALVARVAGKRTGNELKERQHAVAQYHNASLGKIIGSIRPEVQARLAQLLAESPA